MYYTESTFEAGVPTGDLHRELHNSSAMAQLKEAGAICEEAPGDCKAAVI